MMNKSLMGLERCEGEYLMIEFLLILDLYCFVFETCDVSTLIDWAQAFQIGVLDCALEKNFDICKEFGIHFYPTFRVCLYK